MPNPQNVIGKGRKFEKGDPRTTEAAIKGAKTRVANINMRKTMSKILGSSPELSPDVLQQMKHQGINPDDSDVRSTAALIGLVLTKKALKGDVNAARMVLEMAGQITDARTVTDRERLKLERQRLELERQGLAQNEVTIGAIDPFITALTQFGASQGITTDIPEGIIDNSGVSDEEAAE